MYMTFTMHWYQELFCLSYELILIFNHTNLKSVEVRWEMRIVREPRTQLGYSSQVPPTRRGSIRTFKAGTSAHGTQLVYAPFK